MIYIEDKRVVFVAIPKTGTRSVYQILRNNYGAKMHKEHFPVIPNHLKDYYSFTIVRNPYERVVSMWWSTCKRDQQINKERKASAGSNFTELAGSDKLVDLLKYMIKDPYNGKGSELFSKQSDYLRDNDFDKILMNETLTEEFSKLPFLDNKERLPRINTTTTTWGANTQPRNPDPFHYIDQECLELINEYYAEDFIYLKQYTMITDIKKYRVTNE